MISYEIAAKLCVLLYKHNMRSRPVGPCREEFTIIGLECEPFTHMNDDLLMSALIEITTLVSNCFLMG